jgi:hypothetical protein
MPTPTPLTLAQALQATRLQHLNAARNVTARLHRYLNVVSIELEKDKSGAAPGAQITVDLLELRRHQIAIEVIDAALARVRAAARAASRAPAPARPVPVSRATPAA